MMMLLFSPDSTSTMTTSSENPYLRDAVMTATSEQLQLMLYDGAIRYARQARDAIINKNFEQSYDLLTRAQNVIAEMQAGLRPKVNEELCARVSSIYDFLYHKLVDANIHRDIGAIDDALRVLAIERETWQLVVDKVSKAMTTKTDDDVPVVSPETDSESEHVGFSVEC